MIKDQDVAWNLIYDYLLVAYHQGVAGNFEISDLAEDLQNALYNGTDEVQ